MSALLILHREDDGTLTNIPFAYRSGELSGVAEMIADVLIAVGAVASFWEGVAADRLRTILIQRQELAEWGEAFKEAAR